MFLLEVVNALNDAGVPYILVGGYAVAFHGFVRATVDVDLVISLKEKDLANAEKAMNAIGLTSRLPIRSSDLAKFHEEYRTERNLLAWSFVDYKNPSRQVDLLIFPPIGKVKSELLSLHGKKIRVATKRALLDMKLAANRPEDQLDIVKLREALKNEKK